MNRNNLTGGIPKTIQFIFNLRLFELYDNELTGEIPDGLESLDRLEKLYIFGNKLTGSLPGDMLKRRGLSALVDAAQRV